MHPRKIILWIVVLCFIAHPVFYNVLVGITAFIYSLTDFDGYKVTATSIYLDDCAVRPGRWIPQLRMRVVHLVTIFFCVTAFVLSKRGHKQHNTPLMIAAAVLFYLPAFMIFDFVRNALFHTDMVVSLFSGKEQNQQVPMRVFGNTYNYRLTMFVLQMLSFLLYLSLGWIMVFKHWDITLRICLFTLGVAAFCTGVLCWLFILGPLVYPG